VCDVCAREPYVIIVDVCGVWLPCVCERGMVNHRWHCMRGRETRRMVCETDVCVMDVCDGHV